MDYKKFTDEELVKMAQSKDAEAMTTVIERYKNYVKIAVRPYFICGGDSEDLLQEGMLGVFRAVETFNGKASFKSYVYICIKSGILSLIRKYNSDKNKPLNNFISLSGDSETDVDKNCLMSSLKDNPEKTIIDTEGEKEFFGKVEKSLSSLEFKILNLFLEGYSYLEIANKLSKNEKSIDNALQRIRKKVAVIYGE